MSDDQFFFRTPWALNGDTAAIPEATQPDGSLSFNQGYPIGYQTDPAAGGIDIPRLPFNELMFLVTQALQVVQTQGFPNFIASADNDGSPYSYAKNATVRATDGNNYYSLIDANTDTPPSSNWGLVTYINPELPGVTKEYYGASLPSGYVWANGTTIGDASSGSTGRADPDTISLFTLLWNSVPNSTLTIQNSDGSAGSRGISAAADFAAHKRFPVPDRRENTSAGLGNMGGTADPSRMTLAGCGFSPTTLCANGGLETVSLTGNQNGTHTHVATTASAGAHTHTGATDAGAGSHEHFTTAVSSTFVSLSNTNYLSYGMYNSAFVGAFGAFSGTATPATLGRSSATTLPAISFTTGSAGTHTHDMTVSNSGLGSAHQNTQPTIIANFIIKL